MWALIQDDKVVEIYNYPKSVIINEVRYPSNMFTLYTKEEKEQIGIYDVVEKTKPSIQFGYTSQVTFEYDTVNKIVSETFDIFDHPLEDLKRKEINKTKSKAYGYIKRFSWLVERSIYDSTQTIPSDVTTYVTNVRTACDVICTAIENATTMDEFKVLFDNIYNKDKDGFKVATINNWPDDYNVRKYIR